MFISDGDGFDNMLILTVIASIPPRLVDTRSLGFVKSWVMKDRATARKIFARMAQMFRAVKDRDRFWEYYGNKE